MKKHDHEQCKTCQKRYDETRMVWFERGKYSGKKQLQEEIHKLLGITIPEETEVGPGGWFTPTETTINAKD